ncbi:unnamed protein product, partial [Musa acuminata var. zebrina]
KKKKKKKKRNKNWGFWGSCFNLFIGGQNSQRIAYRLLKC